MPTKYRIHPAIGIARVGDSPDDFFVGPEAPGVLPKLNQPDDASTQPGKYKDAAHQIKRQGARFRVYEYTEDSAGAVTKVREITAAEAQIEWEVHLVNGKAAAPIFNVKKLGTGQRNAAALPEDLIIDAGAQRISGARQAMKPLGGKFMKRAVKLGDLLTDSVGRLIVLGGHGHSQAVPAKSPLNEFADNDGWCDDTADGPVRATIKLKGGTETITADSAWVIVAPPDFAPPIENVITLYDVVYQQMTKLDPKLVVTDASRVSFTKDVYPILRRAAHMAWVSVLANGHHHFLEAIKAFASNKTEDAPSRQRVFGRLRNPNGGNTVIMTMPKLHADLKGKSVTLTLTQYKRMELWAKGQFEADWPGAEPTAPTLDQLPEAARPAALDRAALEACVGAGFSPGIEVGQIMLVPKTYDKNRLFRLNLTLAPGDLTARMAVPWQADFRECEFDGIAEWWPGQRPSEVQQGAIRAQWVPQEWGLAEMADHWMELGFVVEKKTAGKVEYVEDERSLKPPVTAPPVTVA